MQKRKLIGNVFGQKVAPRGEHLAELDENGPKAFKGLPNACTTCLFKTSTKTNNKDELLIFVTPKILREGINVY